MHGGQDLHVGHGVKAVGLGDALADHAQDQGLQLRKILLLDPEKIGLGRRVRAAKGKLALVDAVGVDHDHALAGLAVDVRQAYGGDHAALDHVAQHIARAHRRQLVFIADENQAAGQGQGAQERQAQAAVEHGDLIHDHDVGGELLSSLNSNPVAG